MSFSSYDHIHILTPHCHVSLLSLLCDNFSVFPYFSQSWKFWGVLLKNFVECLFIWAFLMTFSWMGLWVSEKNITKARCPVRRPWHLYVISGDASSPDSGGVRFLHCKAVTFLSIPLFFEGKSLSPGHSQRRAVRLHLMPKLWQIHGVKQKKFHLIICWCAIIKFEWKIYTN